MRVLTKNYFMNGFVAGSVAFAMLAGFLMPNVVAARTYDATIVSQSGAGSLTFAPGERKTVQVEFLNSSATF